ncbi:GntR family transcriptional regulator [Streptomyces anulatus]|uniref:GntR family transcriptional regulator n=1 Tax=Streptomyces anulatus TaxID=1892 RepID=UPI001C26FA6F|nr:GntR family transcriptional regulator [Streptomyces anulatus]
MLNTQRPAVTAVSPDLPLLHKVRQRLLTAGYVPGQALPAGLIAHHLQVPTRAVNKALSELARSGTVAYRQDGEHGPGYYMPRPHRRNAPTQHRVRAGAAA